MPCDTMDEDEDDDAPEITGIVVRGKRIGVEATFDDLLRVLLPDHVCVKKESAEADDDGPAEAIGVQELPAPTRPSQAQMGIIWQLARGSNRFDPAHNRGALKKYGHLAQDLDAACLLQTHDNVSRDFAHGLHVGQSVTGLTEQLLRGYDAKNITPLVVIRCLSENWVVFGNRRLKALKEFVDRSGKMVRMRCIVHNFDSGERMVPSELFAKFLQASSTMNRGLFAGFRSQVSRRH